MRRLIQKFAHALAGSRARSVRACRGSNAGSGANLNIDAKIWPFDAIKTCWRRNLKFQMNTKETLAMCNDWRLLKLLQNVPNLQTSTGNHLLSRTRKSYLKLKKTFQRLDQRQNVETEKRAHERVTSFDVVKYNNYLNSKIMVNLFQIVELKFENLLQVQKPYRNWRKRRGSSARVGWWTCTSTDENAAKIM